MGDAVGLTLKYGCGIGVGGRAYQEDRLVAINNSTASIDDPSSFFFAVFDGHGGDRASSLLSKELFSDIKSHQKFNSLPIVALQESWARFDDKIFNEFRRFEKAENLKVFPSDGSTATVCLISGNDVYITNCGDSACFSIMPDGTTEQLTEDHGTNNPEEVDRCIKAGGSLKEQVYSVPAAFPFCCFGVPLPTKPRMMPGGLLVTRSFGDFSSKIDYLGGRKGVVIPTHGRIKYINAAKAMPKYLVLGSDGIWDALTIEQVALMISQHSAISTGTVDASSTAGTAGASATLHTVNTSPPAPTNGGKSSPQKVHPEGSSQTDLVDTASTSTAAAVEAAQINASAAQLDSDLNKLATAIVHAAVTSPKWKQLGAPTIRLFFLFCIRSLW